MANPTSYNRTYGFEGFQASNPKTPLPGIRLDAELDMVSDSIASLMVSLADVRRSDGALKNGIVTVDSLAPGFGLGGGGVGGGGAAVVDWDSVQNRPSTFVPAAHTHAQSSITGLVTALTGKAASDHTHIDATTLLAGFMTAADKTKLNGIATAANLYVLPQATTTVLGGVKVGSGLVIDGTTGVLSVSGGGTGSGGAAYNPAAVAITGGTLNNTAIGLTTINNMGVRNIGMMTGMGAFPIGPSTTIAQSITAEIPFWGTTGKLEYGDGRHLFAAQMIHYKPTDNTRDGQEFCIYINSELSTGLNGTTAASWPATGGYYPEGYNAGDPNTWRSPLNEGGTTIYSDPINDGKTILGIGTYVKPGAGHFWNIASNVDIDSNWTARNGYNVELDMNCNVHAPPGGSPNVASLFMGWVGTQAATAGIWLTSFGLARPNKMMYYGLFFQGADLIRENTIRDNSNSPIAFYTPAGTSHSQGVFVDESSSLCTLKVAGNKSLCGIDFTGQTGAAEAIRMAQGQIIKIGGHNLYSLGGGFSARTYLARSNDGTLLMSIDSGGSARFQGTVTQLVNPAG